MAAPRIPRETNPLCWLPVAVAMVAVAAALVLLLAGCGGGGDPDPPPACGAGFVGPLPPGGVAPGCEADGRAG